MPTRLVSVSNNCVRLILSGDLPVIHRYSTLSYCWGKEKFLCLTRENYDAWLKDIPYDGLPRLFREAISITRELGLSFIWIDALCILQDKGDHSDWLRESVRMKSVYGGSYVNIAMSSAIDVHSSCWSRPADFSTGFIKRVTTNEFGRVQSFHTSKVYEDATTETHLSTRAWTLQERLLAHRTIYVGDTGMFWECRTMAASESLPGGFPEMYGQNLTRPDGEPFDWTAIVKQFSKANLTDGTDKLPALSGIAKHQYEGTGEDYLAGMWKQDLVRQLGWSTARGERRPEWRAPTWSWASIDTETTLRSYLVGEQHAADVYVQVLHAWTELEGPDPFGPVCGGELRLSCPFMIRGRFIDAVLSIDGSLVMFQGIHWLMDCLGEVDIANSRTVFLLPLFGGFTGASFERDIEEFYTGRSKEQRKIERQIQILTFNPAEVENRDQEVDKHKGEQEEEDRTDDQEEYKDEQEIQWLKEMMICGIILSCGSDSDKFRRVGSFEIRREPGSPYYDFLKVMKESKAPAVRERGEVPPTQLTEDQASYSITLV